LILMVNHETLGQVSLNRVPSENVTYVLVAEQAGAFDTALSNPWILKDPLKAKKLSDEIKKSPTRLGSAMNALNFEYFIICFLDSDKNPVDSYVLTPGAWNKEDMKETFDLFSPIEVVKKDDKFYQTRKVLNRKALTMGFHFIERQLSNCPYFTNYR